MRTMFAVGHQNRTHTRIVITGRLRGGRRAAVERTPPRPPVPISRDGRGRTVKMAT